MSKTQFIEGSILTPTFMADSFGTNASTGHVHDSVDADGHQPKILLTDASCVTGLLPLANIAGQTTRYFKVKATSASSDLTADTTADLAYETFGNRTTLFFPKLYGTGGGSLKFRIYPFSGDFPEEVAGWTDSSSSTRQIIPTSIINDSVGVLPGAGYVYLPSSTGVGECFTFCATKFDGTSITIADSTSSFTGTYVGVYPNSITYRNQVDEY